MKDAHRGRGWLWLVCPSRPDTGVRMEIVGVTEGEKEREKSKKKKEKEGKHECYY